MSDADGPTGGGTDLHNHLIPGVDDGAADAEEARAALLALRDAGVRCVATTPHVDASQLLRASWQERAAALDAAWDRLVGIGADAAPDVTLVRGAELRLDIADADLSDPRVRYGGGATALVEFAYFNVPPYSERIVARLVEQRVTPVIAHPERYRGVASSWGVVQAWREVGGITQVNAGSFLGRYGKEPRENALRMLDLGWIDVVASDYHARGVPHLQAARSWLQSNGAEEQAHLLFVVNPARVLSGERPLPVPAVARKRDLLHRLWDALRDR